MEAQRFEFRITGITGVDNSTTKIPVLRYKGRNGLGICNGITLQAENGVVSLMPYNSKGAVSGSCHIDLPDNPKALRRLGQILIDRATSLEVKGSKGEW